MTRPRKTPEEVQATCVALAGAAGCLDPRCPALIETALVDAGWHYAGPHMGWSSDHIMHFYYWEIPAARIIFASASPDNK